MEISSGVRKQMLRFYDRISASDVASFDELVSGQPGTLVIGTAPGEWVAERERQRYGFEAEGLRLEPGIRATGYEEGSVGWFVDDPTFIFPDGSSMHTRLTSVLHREDGQWKIVQMHFSVGVPDEEVTELQERWAASDAGGG